MTIRLINKTVLHCKCVWCNYEWDTFEKPKRCASCKRFSWNGEDQRRRDPLEYVPPGSVLEKKVPELQRKEVIDALMSGRAIIEQLIIDNPCGHPQGRARTGGEECVCAEKEVVDKMNRQIEMLNRFAATQAVKYVRVGRGPATAKAKART